MSDANRVPIAAIRAELLLQMFLEIILDAVVVQERVVHVNEEHDGVWLGHEGTPQRDSLPHMPGIVPQSNHSLGAAVFIAENAQAGRI